MTPEDLKYAKTHEWVHVEQESSGARIATVGISAFAVEALTDLVFIDLPEVGQKVSVEDGLGEVESVKAVSDLYSPVAGEIVEVNSTLPEELEKLSNDCYGEGWIAKIKLSDEATLDHLLDFAAYQKQCAEEEH